MNEAGKKAHRTTAALETRHRKTSAQAGAAALPSRRQAPGATEEDRVLCARGLTLDYNPEELRSALAGYLQLPGPSASLPNLPSKKVIR